LSDLRELNSDQLDLFRKLPDFEKALAIALLSGLGSVQAFRQANPASTTPNVNARVIVSRTRAKPEFMAFMDAVQLGMASIAIMDFEEAMEKLTVIARANLDEMITYRTVVLGQDVKGNDIEQSVWKFNDSLTQLPGNMEAISELKSGANGLSIKLYSAPNAIAQMAVMRGWNMAAKVDLKSSDGSMTPKPAVTIDTSKLSNEALLEIASLYYAPKDNE